MEKLKASSAYSVFESFYDISQIPRCSNDEEKISKYIYEFGKSLGYKTKRDHVGNVLVTKPASPGYEDHDTVVLQAHLDMVCEKTEESLHNFTCDPIELKIDGDYIKANDTTLGADDGIGVALMMAILKDNTLNHPTLECIFTTTEETGMDGAIGMSDDMLTGKNLINLDNEEDWIVIVGCAGGINAYLNHDLTFEKKEGLKNYKIKVSGLQGGHSGSMIGEPRLNAIKLLNSVLVKLRKEINIALSDIKGGSKHNAIPSMAYANIAIDPADVEDFKNIYTNISNEIKDSSLKREIDIEFTLEEIEEASDFIADESVNKILKILSTFPHGVNTVDKELNIVKSSNNLAIIKLEDNKFFLQTSIRSSDKDDMTQIKEEVKKQAEVNDFTIKFSEGYPMWKPNFDNELLDKAKEVYKGIKGSEIEVLVIHAGLETGILSEKYPEMNMISIGPTITGAHTPLERLSIKSTEFTYEFLKTLIKNL